jgi:hypothetical protein
MQVGNVSFIRQLRMLGQIGDRTNKLVYIYTYHISCTIIYIYRLYTSKNVCYIIYTYLHIIQNIECMMHYPLHIVYYMYI